MTDGQYIHGYLPEEQHRLVSQAQYWRHMLIPLGLDYRSGDRVLEIGCAAGATLAILASDFPGIRVAGVDIEAAQLDFARRHFASLKLPEPDLRLADGKALPWTSGFFDHVYIMWLIEHLPDSMPMLREARRVLRPGGTVTATETDYTTFKVLPNSVDWDYLAAAQFKYFQRYGNAEPGRQLGGLLRQAGFSDVRNVPVGFHFFHDGGDGLRRHVEYIGGFLEPAIPKLAGLGLDEARLRSGLKHLRSIPEARNGSMTTVVYRAQGQNAGADSS